MGRAGPGTDGQISSTVSICPNPPSYSIVGTNFSTSWKNTIQWTKGLSAVVDLHVCAAAQSIFF